MALDGIVVANLRKEIEDRVLSGRISKIAQPEADELLLTIKSQKGKPVDVHTLNFLWHLELLLGLNK